MKTRHILVIGTLLTVTIASFFIFSKKNQIVQENIPQDVVGLNVGNTAPAFMLQTIDGKQITSEGLRGKIIVLTSSASWCSSCVYEAQEFSRVYNSMKGKDVVFLTIDIDPRSDTLAIHQFREGTQTSWDYADAKGGVDVIASYHLNRFEITYVIDKNNIIRYKDSSITPAETLTNILTSLL